MAFPSSALGTILQLKINNAWTNAVRFNSVTKLLQKPGIVITRGQGGLQEQTHAGTCQWAWQDPTGVYNNDNPRSSYYRLLPRNTPVRVYVPHDAVHLMMLDGTYTSSGASQRTRCETTDKAALDITGDIDVRIDFEPTRWTRWHSGTPSGVMILCGKFISSGNQRSWHLRIREDGYVTLVWSTNGINSLSESSTVPLDFSQSRICLRVTLDVNNGAAGRTTVFYTAPSMAGSFTQLGSTVITAGTTSIFSSSAILEVGTIGNENPLNEVGNSHHFVGRVYGFQLRNSAGTMVANADFTAQTPGTNGFNDGLGNNWSIYNNAGGDVSSAVANADYRFYGELSATVLRPERSNDGAGIDIKVEADAGGIIRRLSGNDAPIESPVYAGFKAFTPNLWFPGEDSTQADTDQASSAVTGVDPAIITDISFSGYDLTLAGSAGVMTFGANPSFIGAGPIAPVTTETHFIGYFKFDSVPVSEVVMFRLYVPNGHILKWHFTVSSGNYTLRGYNATGTEVATKQTTFGASAPPTDWIAYHLQLTESGGTVTIKSEWMSIDSGVAYTQTPIGTTTYGGSNGSISRIAMSGTGLADLKVAHLMASTQVGLTFWDGAGNAFAQFSRGFPGELADARFIRVCHNNNILPVIIGKVDDSERMGVQPIDTVMAVLYQSASVDGGYVAEAVDQLALEFYTRKSLLNQYGNLELTWADLADGLEATPDDTDIANDITLSRVNGGSARATLEYGTMSVQDPPDGISRVPYAPQINNNQDSRLPLLVQHMLMIRSWPTPRYPSVVVKLEHPTYTADAALTRAVTRTGLTNRISITDLPTFMAPDTIDLFVRGIQEELGAQERHITWSCVPYGPYMSSELSIIDSNPYMFVAAHHTIDGVVQTQLNSGATIGALSLSVKTLSGPLIDTAGPDFMIKIEGEYMLVTAVSGASSPQTLTVTRGIIGSYAESHGANDYVYVYPTLRARL